MKTISNLFDMSQSNSVFYAKTKKVIATKGGFLKKIRIAASLFTKIAFVKNPPKSHTNLQKLNKIIEGHKILFNFCRFFM